MSRAPPARASWGHARLTLRIPPLRKRRRHAVLPGSNMLQFEPAAPINVHAHLARQHLCLAVAAAAMAAEAHAVRDVPSLLDARVDVEELDRRRRPGVTTQR
ncbi:Hypothetical Protein FCC1311_086112 [Hondaea fermentalgiana]|uniref:Uncharacterized protein n=1 Tax=Hondaea fermentalgiana TaxID=2315210 RepID=A0A2R5GNB8_9STRA|nr:Hypothetical Protein FCC1311_086112 [Hondaea fermentalgiana]|eukprot:GBG32386.1 Hypothetical Protein FCC1311_086112 [Hondaea fermentalgiana]